MFLFAQFLFNGANNFSRVSFTPASDKLNILRINNKTILFHSLILMLHRVRPDVIRKITGQ